MFTYHVIMNSETDPPVSGEASSSDADRTENDLQDEAEAEIIRQRLEEYELIERFLDAEEAEQEENRDA